MVVGGCGDRSKPLNLDARSFYDRGDYKTGIILLQHPSGASHCTADTAGVAGGMGSAVAGASGAGTVPAVVGAGGTVAAPGAAGAPAGYASPASGSYGAAAGGAVSGAA